MPRKPPAAPSPPPPRVPPELARRLADALGQPPDKVQRALDAIGATLPELLRLVAQGSGSPRLAELARALRVDEDRLLAALLDLADLAVSRGAAGPTGIATSGLASDALAASMRGGAEEALGIALEILGESLPRAINHVLLVLALAGASLVALGLLAVFGTTLFVQLLAVLAGIALVATGAAMFTLAWRLHEATSTVRLLGKVAKRWRGRQAARAAAPAGDAPPDG